MAKKKLEIDWSDLCMALETYSHELFRRYLDTETGEIVLVTEDARQYAETDEDLEGFHGVERDDIELARRVFEGYGERYILIDPRPSHDSYTDMEGFIETVKSPKARSLLERAINGRGAFRKFKDTLAEFPAEQKRWYAWKDHATELYAQDWLEGKGIEPLNPVEEPEERVR